MSSDRFVRLAPTNHSRIGKMAGQGCESLRPHRSVIVDAQTKPDFAHRKEGLETPDQIEPIALAGQHMNLARPVRQSDGQEGS